MFLILLLFPVPPMELHCVTMARKYGGHIKSFWLAAFPVTSMRQDHYPKWCYVNARDLPDSDFKTLCASHTWSWCNAAEQTSTPARWNLLPGATIIGNEKRFETIYLSLSCVSLGMCSFCLGCLGFCDTDMFC